MATTADVQLIEESTVATNNNWRQQPTRLFCERINLELGR